MSPNLVAIAGTAEGAARTAQAAGPLVDAMGGPLGLVGRAVGLSPDELEAGIPGWAWAFTGVVAGAVIGYLLHDKIQAFRER